MTTKAELLARIDAHEKETAAIETAMAELGITAKDVKALRKAQQQAEAARRTLAELMGGLPAADVSVETVETAPDPNAEPVVSAAQDAEKPKKQQKED